MQSHAQLREEAEQRQQLREQLAHTTRLSTMGEMATGLAHELNQPLTAIANYAGAATHYFDGSADPGKVHGCLQRIQDQAIRAGEMIRRLRTFVARRPSARVPVSLNELVREVLGLQEHDLHEHQVQVVQHLAARLPPVSADPVQVQQVLVNLLRNAIDAMSGQPASRRVLTLETARLPDAVVVRVTDTGGGLAPEIADHLFQPFQTTKASGLGLGLAISQSLIEAHGGLIGTLARTGDSTTFWFQLPLVAEDRAP